MRDKLIVLLFCLCTAPSFGQEVVFNVSPRDAFVRINGEVIDLKKQQRISLDEGTYTAEIWAPRFETLTKEIIVAVGSPLVVTLGLKKTAGSYDAHQVLIEEHNTKRLKQNLRDGTVLGLFSGFTFVALTGRRSKAEKLIEEISLRRSAYAAAISQNQIQSTTEAYDNVVNEYEDVERSHNFIVVTTGVLAAATAAFGVVHFTSKNRYRDKRPVYEADRPFSGFEARKRPSLHLGTNTSLIGLTLKF